MKERIKVSEEQKDSAKKSPIKTGEVFDPKKELKEIRKASKEEQKEKLGEFKEKLAYQKEGLADMQMSVTKIIRENSDAPAEKLSKMVQDVGPALGLSENRKELIKSVLKEYESKHKFLQHLRERHEDDEDLFRAVFRKKLPKLKGGIEIIESSIMFYICFNNPEDYLNVHIKATEGPIDDRDIQNIKTLEAYKIPNVFLVPGIEDSVIIENSSLVESPEYRKAILSHEEQHIISSFFKRSWQRKFFKNEFRKAEKYDDKKSVVRKYFLFKREPFEKAAGDEIIAFLKEGYEPDEVFEVMNDKKENGSYYDYFGRYKNDIFKELRNLTKKTFESDDIEMTAEDIFVRRYNEILKRGIGSFRELEANGYSRDKAISILMTEPIIKWPKVVSRLLEAKK